MPPPSPRFVTFGSTVEPQGADKQWWNSGFGRVQKTSSDVVVSTSLQVNKGVEWSTEDEHERSWSS